MKIVSSNFLKDAVIKSVLEEYEVRSQELVEDELKYGSTIIEPVYDPFLLRDLREMSGLHDLCISTKAEDTILSGKKIVCDGEIDNDLEGLIEDFDFEEQLESFVEDFDTYGFSGMELLKEDAGKLIGINHVNSLYLRMCKDKERAVQKIGTNEIYFKIFKKDDTKKLNKYTGDFEDNLSLEDQAHELIWFNRKSEESKVYGKPVYISEIEAIMTDNAIINYQKGHFNAHGIPNYMITVTGTIDIGDDEDNKEDALDAWESDLEKEFQQISNTPGTALCMVLPSAEKDGVQVNVTKIGDEKKEGSFLELSESVRNRIREIHKIPKERLGAGTSEGIASNRTKELLKNYSNTTIRNSQRRIASFVTKKIIRNCFGISDTILEMIQPNFDNEEDKIKTGIHILQNGGATLGEFVNTFCSAYGFSMDESDEFYNSRFMNNQSLDSVVYGDNKPTDPESKLSDVVNNLENKINE